MNERNPLGKMEVPRVLEVHALTSAADLETFFRLADEMLHVNWGEDGVPENYTPEYIAAHPDETQVFCIRENDEIVAGGKVTKLDRDAIERLGFDTGAYAEREGALLEYAVVREDQRNKRIYALLKEKRIEWAKEHGAHFVCTEIELTNPISAHIQTRDGFVFIGVKAPSDGIPQPYLVGVRSIADDLHLFVGEGANIQFETKEVTVTEESQEELASLFADGWIGVDAQVKTGPVPPWTLVLKRVLSG